MPRDHRWAGAPAVRPPRRSVPRARRSWRRRSRRAQVSAVATILGLLLVVTFIANYLSTTLPNTMGQNDLQHELAVEGQVAQLSARAQAIASAGIVGAQVSQPVTLGSVGAPPFANPDGSYLTPIASVANTTGNYPGSSISFTLSGPVVYTAPTGGPSGGIASGCTTTSDSILCSGAATVIYNFTGALANQAAYSLTMSGGGSAHVNISASSSTITVTPSSTTLIVLYVLGNHDTVVVTVSTVPETIVVVGSNDTLEMTGSASPSTRTNVLMVGNYDTITTTALSGTNTFVASVYGSNDVVNPGTLSGTNTFGVYFNGFNPASPNGLCPVANLSKSDTVSQPTGSGTFSVNYNNTVYSGSGTNGVWHVTYKIPAQTACPFNSISQVAASPVGGAGFVVHLQNTYAPSAEVAYDEGAVVYAQGGGLPIFIVPPPVTLAGGTLTVFLPWFANPVPGEAGLGSADINLQVRSTSSLSFPSHGFTFASGSSITIRWVTPYAAAWYAYFQTSTAFSSYVTCTGSNSVCTALYAPNSVHPLGTVTLTIPVSGVKLSLATVVFGANVI